MKKNSGAETQGREGKQRRSEKDKGGRNSDITSSGSNSARTREKERGRGREEGRRGGWGGREGGR